MNHTPDPLLGAARPDRLHYATGELLGADDFVAEQTYHRRQLARALQYLHGSGTVVGLRVLARHRPGETSEEDGADLLVEPGLAVDRAGRFVEVPRAVCLRLRRWFEHISATPPENDTHFNQSVLDGAWRGTNPGDTFGPGDVVADVFLAFHPCERGYTPAFATGPFDALDASQPSRVRDGYELLLVPRTEADDALPRASDPWASLEGATVEERLAAARALSLGAWERAVLPPPDHVGDWNENPASVDPAAVLLARVRLSVERTAEEVLEPDWGRDVWPAPDAPPDPSATTPVDNTVRHVVLPTAAVLRVAGV